MGGMKKAPLNKRFTDADFKYWFDVDWDSWVGNRDSVAHLGTEITDND